MHPAEIENALAQMTLLVDTREHDNQGLKRRLAVAGLPWERVKLNAGDYSAKFPLPDGQTLDLSDQVVIERKMSLDELAMCFAQQRDRFIAEFERAAKLGTRIYLLIEGASYEKIIKHQYRSHFNERAFLASLLAFQARYTAPVVMCQRETSGQLIREILRREAKERLST